MNKNRKMKRKIAASVALGMSGSTTTAHPMLTV